MDKSVKRRRSPYEIPMSKLRKARIEKGLILEDVARATGYSCSAITKAELGLTNRNKSRYRSYDSRTELFWSVMSTFYGIPESELRR